VTDRSSIMMIAQAIYPPMGPSIITPMPMPMPMPTPTPMAVRIGVPVPISLVHSCTTSVGARRYN
jgi:hypothetical protein